MTRRLAALAAIAILARPPLDAAEQHHRPTIAGKVRHQVAFSLADEFPNAPGRQYALTRVQRNGLELPPPRNMKLDAKTGSFAWTPTESQCGEFEIHFLVRNPGGHNARTTRRVSIATPPIVPPGDKSQVAKLLRQWYAEGTAAGNTGDFYDNRDRGHSMLNTKPYPQLDKVEYTEEQRKKRLDWALQLRFIFPHVTFGNSSTASGDPNLGSNPRHALLLARGAGRILHLQYTRNHLYIYPEHRDYDPGHNGRGGGYGDLFPANTPYFIISQGSSGSDKPFMRAIPYVLAAFRPEVKELLVGRGLLMPTVQMILRMCYSAVKKPDDYLTGKAHPTVFQGGGVNVLKMVKMAHDIRRNNVPPMVQLALLDEDTALNGVDYFEPPGVTERLLDTPEVIARIVRSTKHTRRLVVSARDSFDANGRPLAFRWVVLRGDPQRITIKPLDDEGSAAEIRVAYHHRRPIAPGSEMESNRVDIGVFAHNGAYWSAPAFVCLYSLDDEARTYDPQGRIREVYYGYGDATIGYPNRKFAPRDKGYDITDWPALLAIACNEKAGLPAQTILSHFTPAELADLAQVARKLRSLEGDEAGPPKEADAARQAAARLLTLNRPALKGSVKRRIEAALNAARADVEFCLEHAKALDALLDACPDPAAKKAFLAARDELVKIGLLKTAGGALALNPAIPGNGPPAARLTRFERSKLEWLNIAAMRHLLYPGIVNRRYRRNFVSVLLATPKAWRDLYHYGPRGRLIGWTRFRGAQRQDFTPDGALVTKKDALGRPIEARTVRYVVEGKRTNRRLKQEPGDTIRCYEYAGDSDRLGRLVATRKVPP